MGSLLAALMAELTLITYRTYKQGWTKQYPLPMPLPADYVGATIVFGLLGLANEAEVIRPIPSVAGWAFVAATLLGVWSPGGGVIKGAPPGVALSSVFSPGKQPKASTNPQQA